MEAFWTLILAFTIVLSPVIIFMAFEPDSKQIKRIIEIDDDDAE